MRLPAERTVRVRVPATSANLGPGFDAFGLALDLCDEVEVSTRPAGLAVAVAGEGADVIPRDASHLVVRALLAGLDELGVRVGGLALRCTNRIPHGRGLGSSAAAIVAGLLAARELAGARRDDEWLLRQASTTEGHPDNVAAALLGGFTIAWTDGAAGGARAVRLEPDRRVRAVVFVADTPLATTVARRLLPASVPHPDAARTAGRAGLLVEALTRRPDLLLPATEDVLHQPYRAAAMPASAQLLARLRAAGVPAVVSGAGPSVLALGTADTLARAATVSAPGFRPLPLQVGAAARSG